MLGRLLCTVVLLLVALLLLQLEYSQRDAEAGVYKVTHITDGDSIYVRDKNQNIRVRMIGIDAPETFLTEKAFRDSRMSGISIEKKAFQGKNSTQHLKELLPTGSKVKLVSDHKKHDKYGRQLAYVFNHNGDFINLKMVEDGYAIPMPFPPNTRYKQKFASAAKEARMAKTGLWRDSDLR